MRTKQLQRGLAVVALLLVAWWLGSLIWGLLGKARVAILEAREAQAELKMLETRRAALEASIAALTTARGKDAAIRTAFGVARPGEEVIVVVPPATATPTTTPSWWEEVLNWFN